MELIVSHSFSRLIPDSGLGSILKIQTPTFNRNHPNWDPEEIYHKKGGEKKIGIELEKLTWLKDDSIQFYFFTKYDLLSYLYDVREDFIYPNKDYINKKFLPQIYSRLLQDTKSLKEDIFIFNAQAKKDGDNSRAYINFDSPSDTEIYSNFIDICLSSVTDMEFNIINDDESKNKYVNIKPKYNMTLSIDRLNQILESTSVSEDQQLFYFIFKYGNNIKNFGGVSIFDSNNIYQNNKKRIDDAYNVFDMLNNENINIGYEYPSAITILKKHLRNCQDKPLQQILFGAPGTGKSHTINSDANITEQNSIRTTFHPDSDYSTFVGCYKPTKDEKSGEITYDFTPQAFTNAYVAAWKDLDNPFYLIIEEINRGNCAQIFGDIFQLLDRDENGYSSYKITPDKDLTNYICKQLAETDILDPEVKSGEKMQLPQNLHIWATMNTSDQSLFPIDSAFKRRWDWRYIPIDYTDKNHHYIACGDTQYSWADFLQKVNDKVESVTQSEDKKLGYWFMGNGAEQKEITVDRFVSKVVFYLWNDVFKDFGKSGNTIFKDTFAKFHMFFDFRGKPKVDVVKAFLDALEVAERKDIFTNEELNEASNTSSSRFTLNGERLSLKDIAYKVVENYAGSNPTFTATQIKTVFIEACKNCGISHIVETNEEYQQRLSTQSSAERSQTSLKLNNGEIIHITTQWRAKKPEDNFFKFIEVCNKNNWGDIQKVEQ